MATKAKKNTTKETDTTITTKEKTIKTYDELNDAVYEIIPNACFEEDNDGQIIIYTSLRRTPTGKLKDYF